MPEKELKTKEMDELCEAFLELRTAEECKKFLRDLCTISEIQAMVERFQVAKRVLNKEPYREIAKNVPSSTATVTRVAHWLSHGMGGYLLVLERIKRK